MVQSVCQFASCCMSFAIIIQWIYFSIWKKIKKNHHHYNTISSLYNIISRHYKKSLLRSQIYHGYEDTDYGHNTLYEGDKTEEASMRCSLLHGSWDQLLQRCPSVCLSLCLSVCLSHLFGYHRIITKFSGVITNDRSDVHAKGQGHRSKVKVTEVITQLSCFRTVPPVWIHIWWWNDAQSLMLLRRCALLFFKVICQISRSHGSKNRRFWPKLGVSGL